MKRSDFGQSALRGLMTNVPGVRELVESWTPGQRASAEKFFQVIEKSTPTPEDWDATPHVRAIRDLVRAQHLARPRQVRGDGTLLPDTDDHER